MVDDPYPNFIPQWTRAIEHINKKKFGFIKTTNSFSDVLRRADEEFDLKWTSGRCCLTGEAFLHKFAPDCVLCKRFTHDKSMIAMTSIENLYNYKKELAEHLQRCHPETWEKWSK